MDAPQAELKVRSNPMGWFFDGPFSVKNISLVYVFAVVFIGFSLWIPGTFLTATMWKSLASEQAVTLILALAMVITLASGVYDLSVAAILGAAAIFCAHLMADLGMAPIPAVALTFAGALLAGCISAVAVVFFRVNSFIATLGLSSILAAFISMVSNNQQIIGLPESFTKWATFQFLGIQGAFWIALVICAIIWFLVEQRPVGRHMYATGGNVEAARLAGVRTDKIIFGSILAGALVAAVAGVVVTSRVATGSPTIGPPYLLPAFAAAFLGSTQLKPGKVNVVGTIIAVYTLAVSVKGLQLAGAPFWLPELFNGVALIVAVALSVRRARLSVATAPPTAVPVEKPPVTFRQVARPHLESLRDRTEETVRLSSFPDGGGVGRVIEVAEGVSPLRVASRVGETVAPGSADGSQVSVGEADGILSIASDIRIEEKTIGVVSIEMPASRADETRRSDIARSVTDTAAVIGGEVVSSGAETDSSGGSAAHTQSPTLEGAQ